MGYIYILTNPSFEQYVKIGYTGDVRQRLDDLNRSTAVPFAFRVYATYEVDTDLAVDKKLHSILDKLNPDLRSREEVDGKLRVREFYAMTAEDAYSILEAIAEINGLTCRLKKWEATASERQEQAIAQQINEQHQERLSPFAFSKCGISIGETIEFFQNGNAHCGECFKIVDDKRVAYNGETWSLTALAKHLLGTTASIAGPRFFKYKGEWLNDIRHRLGVE